MVVAASPWPFLVLSWISLGDFVLFNFFFRTFPPKIVTFLKLKMLSVWVQPKEHCEYNSSIIFLLFFSRLTLNPLFSCRDNVVKQEVVKLSNECL